MPRPTRLLHSAWSQPAAIQRPAIDFHIEQLAAWLLRAGAEPRLSLVLCAGKGARSRFVEGLAAYGVRVEHTPSTEDRPLPTEILNHHGDHYNDRLFFMDGFADHDPAKQFETLDGQRSVLAKQATWVAVVVENLRGLERLATFAPNLFKTFHRRTLVLAAGAPDEARPNDQLVEKWRQDGRVAELAFVEALSAARPPESYDDFARLLRSGYAGNLLGAQGLHADRAGLLALWRGEPVPAEAEGAVFAAGQARRGGLTEAQAATLGGDPLSLVAGDQAAGLDPVHRALAELVHRPSPKAIAAAAAVAGSDRLADDLAAELWLALGAAQAQAGELDATVAAVQTARQRAEGKAPPELAFEAVEKHAALLTFLGERALGQRAVERLAELAVECVSPWFTARHHAARAAFTEPLDRRRAEQDYHVAAALFESHGWPAEAAEAKAGVERCQ